MITALFLQCKPSKDLQTPEVSLRDIGKKWRLRSEGLVDSIIKISHSSNSCGSIQEFKEDMILPPGKVICTITNPGNENRFSIYAESI